MVGAGPGDPGLLTVRGRALLERCDVVVYDRLVGEALLGLIRADAEKVYVGKEAARHALPQDEINQLLVDRALEGKSVCRLKGGDPFVFGRGGEEALFCREHGVPFEIVPGVSSSIAAPAYAGIPVTQRGVALSFAVVTGHTKDDDAPPPDLPVADTLVFLMGVRALPKIVAQLLARGESPHKPVALVRWGTTTQQEVVTGTLATIEEEVARAGLKPPALIVVGEVVNLREQLQWFDSKPLWGKSVVVTRAREQASSLVTELEELGARVVQCPTIRVEDVEPGEAFDSAVTGAGSFDWIVFSSKNGVEKFWARLQALGLDARAFGNAKIAAIGPATAKALKKIGVTADFVPSSSISEDVAQGLIECGVAGKNILIARAAESRNVIERELAAADANVTSVHCYRTVPEASEAERVRGMLQQGSLDWITFSSSSTVKNFLDAVGKEAVLQARSTFKVACIGPITAETARGEGLEPDVVAESASVAALSGAIQLIEAQKAETQS